MENRVISSRNIDPKVHAVHRHRDVEKFLAAKLKPGIHSLWYRGLPIDMQLTIKESDTLIVVLHGAAITKVHLPWLSGTGITVGMKASRLFVSDPSLYLGEGLALSWFAGNQYQPDLQEILVKVFKRVAESVGAKRIIFVGGSGGGFASLVFSHAIAGSTALVFNPQTILERYPARFVEKWLEVGWGVESLDQLPEHVISDVTSLYTPGFTNEVIYLQNERDSHLGLHMEPFTEAAHEGKNHSQGEYQYLIRPWSKGHTPPPKDLIRSVLERTLQKPGVLIEDFENLNSDS